MNRKILALMVTAITLAGAGATQSAVAACDFSQTDLQVGASGTPIGHARIVMRPNDRPLLMISDDVQNTEALWVYSCANRQCSSGQATPIEVSTNYFQRSGIIVRSTGRPALVGTYFGGLRYYDCGEEDCSQVNVTELIPTQSGILGETPMALQANGTAAFIYVDSYSGARPGQLIYHACADDACSGGAEKVLAIPPDSSSQISDLALAIDADGHPAATYLLSHGASNSTDHWIARCNDSACDNITHTMLAGTGALFSPSRTDLVIRSDRRPLALDSRNGLQRALLDCDDVSCSSATARPLPGDDLFGLALTAGDLPVYGFFSPNWINAWTCTDAACGDGTLDQVGTPNATLREADFERGADGSLYVAYIGPDSSLTFAACLADSIFADGFD
ncbi:hypothetical protein [Dokdonella sp.]|uniref:hypothetical protein n=1 Tax=Dokdonella sp. TaxID=2291710 RepID=UPI0025C23924|nr:hypothetical protein [Dokdonella sp.]MBX3690370.1 hypothetical protein [Dokdonella sp.]